MYEGFQLQGQWFEGTRPDAAELADDNFVPTQEQMAPWASRA